MVLWVKVNVTPIASYEEGHTSVDLDIHHLDLHDLDLLNFYNLYIF